ncbi:MAG: glycosyl transferase [Bacteroidales bacterium]|nr:glycosyl transferase [Bacteroidales bacterium]
MIPKKIHYCWISGDPYPPLIQHCIDSWHKHLPGYEFVLWNNDRFDMQKINWVKEACEHKKYAFAADYIRLYALYTEGGLYLDSDVEVLKDFSPLLHHSSFIGYEASGNIEAAIIGAQPKMEWIKKCLDYYENRHFISPNGTLDTAPLPGIIKKTLDTNYSIPHHANQITEVENIGLTLYPAVYFSPKNYHTKKTKKSKQTYAIHHFDAHWVKKNFSFKIKTFIHRLLIFVFGVSVHQKICAWIQK